MLNKFELWSIADGDTVCATKEHGQGYHMCDEGVRMGIPYVRRRSADGDTVCAMKERGQGCLCATKEHERGCHLCDEGSRTGLPYV